MHNKHGIVRGFIFFPRCRQIGNKGSSIQLYKAYRHQLLD